MVRPIAAVVGALVLTAIPASAARLRVCLFSFHSADEIRVFQTRLSATDFDVVDLSPRPVLESGARGAAVPGAGGAWLQPLCRAGLRCDVVVFSAEFAGRFFGSSGTSIGLQDLEEASCQARCNGLFHEPLEVFLLACNTLATKDQDRRTPDDYLQVLLSHGFDRASAERVVAFRYGPLGPSFRESLRRVFMGVPRVYGFSSVAPLGESTAPMLEKYFRTKGDYRRYLERVQRDPALNAELLAAFAGTGLVQTTGLRADEAAAPDRDRICAIYDDGLSVTPRLEIIRELMGRTDFLAFIPSIQVFIDRHPPDRLRGEDRRLFEQIQALAPARERVLGLVHELDVSALRLEIAHFAVHMGWTSRDELRRLAIDTARELLGRRLSSEVVDIMCEIPNHEPIGDQFGADDIPGLVYADAEGVRLIDCLSPTDPRVTDRLLAGLDGTDESLRLWSAYALSHRLPLPEPVLLRLAAHVDDPSPDLRARVRWILTTQRRLPGDVVDAVADRDPAFARTLGGGGLFR